MCSLFLFVIKGMIRNILQPGSVDPETEMVLVNGIYFKGVWEKAFKVEDTQTMPFRVTEVHGHTSP